MRFAVLDPTAAPRQLLRRLALLSLTDKKLSQPEIFLHVTPIYPRESDACYFREIGDAQSTRSVFSQTAPALRVDRAQFRTIIRVEEFRLCSIAARIT